jgi:hypothetical protein
LWLYCSKKHPPQDPGALQLPLGQERRVLREVEQDRVGLGQKLALVGLEHRDAPVGVDPLQELRGTGLAAVYVVLDPLEGEAELRQQQPDLVPVARGEVVVQDYVLSRRGRRISSPPQLGQTCPIPAAQPSQNVHS